MGLFKKRQHYKFCPVCGNQLKVEDAYCMKCGYSFIARDKKTRSRKRLNMRNLILLIILLVAAYFGFRYLTHRPIIPLSLQDALNFTK